MSEMKYAIGCKLIMSKPMTLGEYNKHRGWTIPENEDPNRKGYLVHYVDQNPVYESWSPAEVFEKFYFPLESEDGSKITQEDMDKMFFHENSESLVDGKSTLVKANTLTGFVQYDVSSCVDPKNYDAEIGKSVAMKRMSDKIWHCMGFVLQWARFGLNGGNK